VPLTFNIEGHYNWEFQNLCLGKPCAAASSAPATWLHATRVPELVGGRKCAGAARRWILFLIVVEITLSSCYFTVLWPASWPWSCD
jgi:hypothetical protein